MNIKQIIKQAREYVEMEAETKVKRISFAGRFRLLGSDDIVLSVLTTDKKTPQWWVVGGSSPMNLYAKSHFQTADEAFSMHTGLMLRVATRNFKKSKTPPKDIGYDAFICHASNDKKKVVRPIAKALEKMGYYIWYDEFELRVGDSLRQSIDRGLVNSKFGIVILSRAFFAKKWTQYELNGLNAKEIHGQSRILPIWHNISRNTILKYSPTLVDKYAVETKGHSANYIANELSKVMG